MQFARTLLGSSWIGLSALLTMSVLGTIYGTLTGVEDWSSYWVYVALGIVSWNTLATALMSSCTVLERSRERLLNQPMPIGVVGKIEPKFSSFDRKPGPRRPKGVTTWAPC